MFKNRVTGEAMYPIEDHEPYAISRTGMVGKCLRISGNNDEYQDYTEVPRYEHSGTMYVQLNHDGGSYKLPVARLSLNSIYGELPFNIIHRDLNRFNVENRNIYFYHNRAKLIYNATVNMSGELRRYNVLLRVYDDTALDEERRSVLLAPIPNNVVDSRGRYWVSMNGAVFDNDRQVFIPRSHNSYGYYRVGLSEVGGSTTISIRVHRAVYASWINPNIEDLTIDHIDGRRHNNNISNLELVSLQENIERARQRNIANENITRAKWSDGEIVTACRLLEKEVPYREIATALGYDYDNPDQKREIQNFIASIRDRRVHRRFSSSFDIAYGDEKYKGRDHSGNFKFSDELISTVMSKLVAGYRPADLAREYPDIGRNSMLGISAGRQYKHLIDKVDGMRDYIDHPENRKPPKTVITDRELKWMSVMKELLRGTKPKDIPAVTGVGYDTVKDINSGKTGANVYCEVPGFAEYIRAKKAA